MNQRPSLVWQCSGCGGGLRNAWRQVKRHSGTRRITQYIRSCSGFFDNRLVDRHRDVLSLAAALDGE